MLSYAIIVRTSGDDDGTYERTDWGGKGPAHPSQNGGMPTSTDHMHMNWVWWWWRRWLPQGMQWPAFRVTQLVSVFNFNKDNTGHNATAAEVENDVHWDERQQSVSLYSLQLRDDSSSTSVSNFRNCLCVQGQHRICPHFINLIASGSSTRVSILGKRIILKYRILNPLLFFLKKDPWIPKSKN